MKMMNNVGMDSPKVGNTSAVDQSTSASDTGSPEAAGLLPEPAPVLLGGDAMAEIAALCAESACNDRKTARKEETVQNIHAEHETHARIAAMRKKADDMRTAAIVSGVAGMAAGAASVAGACVSLYKVGQGTKAALAAAQECGQLGSAASTFLKGGGRLISGIYEAKGQDDDASAAAHEQSAASDVRTAKEHAADASAARDQMNRVMDFLKSVRESQNATARSAIKG